jgi:hypothetical protein
LFAKLISGGKQKKILTGSSLHFHTSDVVRPHVPLHLRFKNGERPGHKDGKGNLAGV